MGGLQPQERNENKMCKTMRWAVNLLAAVLILSLMFTLPSGAVTEEAEQAYADALYEDEGDYVMQLPQPKAVLASAVFSDILPSANVASLPQDLFAPGSTPRAENYTENGYRDETIIVEMEQKRMFDSDVFIAYVKIATPSQLRTAIAGTKLSSSRTNKTTVISSAYIAIVAINGDFYSDSDRQGGHIVRQGQVLRERVSNNFDLMFIDELGDLHIFPKGKEAQTNAVAAFKSEHEIVNGFCFGPGLVIDGEKPDDLDDYGWFDSDDKNPRAAIGQVDMLTYVLVAVNGRTDESVGVTMDEFGQIMLDLGCTQAYNLDGGNSATMAFNGSVFNAKATKERDVSDIIYFASAADAE